MAHFQCRHLRQRRGPRVLQCRWNYRGATWSDSKDSNCRNSNSTNSPIHNRYWCGNSVQNTSDNLFWFSIGCSVVDQRSGDGWFIGRVTILAISLWKGFSKLRDAGQYHQEFPFQKEGQPRGAESPKRGPVSTRKTDGLHDLRLLSSDWRSWYSIRLHWLILCYSSWWQHSGIRCEMGRSSTFYVKKFHPMIFLDKSVQIENTCSLRNSKLYWNCTTWRFIRRYRLPNYQKVEKRWWKGSIDQKLQIKKLWRQTRENWSRSSGEESKGIKLALKEEKVLCYQWKEKGPCSQGDKCSVRHESNDRAQKTEHTAATPSEPTVSRGRSVSRKRCIRGNSNHGSILRQPCRYYLRGTCTRASCEYWHPPVCQSYKNETGCLVGDKCLFPHYKIDEQPNKKPKKSYFPKRRESDGQECCGYCEKCITIGLCITRFRCTRFSR